MQLRAQRSRLAVSTSIESELVAVLKGKFGWSQPRIRKAVSHLWAEARWVEPKPIRASRDPNDDHVLGCAVAAKAHLIISGDRDLLSLHPFQGISIHSPADFLVLHTSMGNG